MMLLLVVACACHLTECMHMGPPIVIDERGNIMSDPMISVNSQRRFGRNRMNRVDEGPTIIVREETDAPVQDQTKLNFDHLSLYPINTVIYMRQPFLIIVPKNTTTNTTAT